MDEYLAFNRKSVDDRQVDTLIGLSKGLLADGQLVQAEVEFLYTWLIQARQATSHPVIINLFDKVSSILGDGVVDREECEELLAILARFNGEKSETGEIAKPTSLPFNVPAPMAHLACFVLTREVVVKSNKGSLSFQERLQVGDQTLAPAWLRSQQLWADLADLWFNSSRGSGIELLLSAPIEQALVTGDGSHLQQLREVHGHAADAIIEKVFDDLELPSPETVLLVGHAFAQVRVAGDFPRSETAMVRDWLRTNVQQVVTWKPEEAFAIGAVELMEFCGAERTAEVLLTALNHGLSQERLAPGIVDQWVSNLLKFLAHCHEIGVPLTSTVLTLLEGGNTLGAVWLHVMQHDPIGRFWGHLRVAGLTAEHVTKDLVPLLNRAEPPPDDLLAAIVAIDDEKNSREWTTITEAIAAPLGAGVPTGEQQQLQLQWRTKWLWVLAQHGSLRARTLMVKVAPQILTHPLREEVPLAFGLAVEYLANEGNDAGAKRRCEKIVQNQRHQDQFAAYLPTWENGQRVVPFVRVTRSYPDDLREFVRQAATTNSRMMARLHEDLKPWAKATPGDPLLQQLIEDAQLSL